MYSAQEGEQVQAFWQLLDGGDDVASAGMARNLAAAIPASRSGQLVDDVQLDHSAGVDWACEQVLAIRDSGAFDGQHLVPVSRYRDVAARLEREL